MWAFVYVCEHNSRDQQTEGPSAFDLARHLRLVMISLSAARYRIRKVQPNNRMPSHTRTCRGLPNERRLEHSGRARAMVRCDP